MSHSAGRCGTSSDKRSDVNPIEKHRNLSEIAPITEVTRTRFDLASQLTQRTAKMRASFLTVLILLLVVQLAGQQAPTEPPTVSAILQRMGNSKTDWGNREEAFDEASKLLTSENTAPRDVERLRLGMIGLLTAENAEANVPDEEMAKLAAAASNCGNAADNCAGAGEAYDEDADAESQRYMQRLMATVAGFNDERAIPALAGALCWGDIVTKPLLALGDKALAAVLDQLKSRNSTLRMCSMFMVISLEAPNGVVSQTRIKELIRSSLNDPDGAVRRHVVQAIDCRKDRQDFGPLLKEIAKTDPQKFPGKPLDGGDADGFYPVRADARRALRHIQNNELCAAP
jgi:hypothetical protein